MAIRKSVIIDPISKRIIVQKPFPKKNCLVIQGGGVRGTAIAGAFDSLYENGLIYDVEHLAGSSAGAISSLIIALGYEPNEATQLLCDLEMKQLLEQSTWWKNRSQAIQNMKQIYDVIAKQSISEGNELTSWLQKIVAGKFGNPHATFRDLANKNEEAKKNGLPLPFKYIYITAVRLSVDDPEYTVFSHQHTPDLEIALAIRASASLPLIFKAVEYDEHIYVDGGVKLNLPFELLNARDFHPAGEDFNHHGINPGILAITLNNKIGERQHHYGIYKKVPLDGITQTSKQVGKALSETVNPKHIRESLWVLPLRDNEVSTFEFGINHEGKVALINNAKMATENFLANNLDVVESVISYPNLSAWLETLSLDDIDDIKFYYEDMLTKTLATRENQEHVASNNNSEIDANHPTIEQLQISIKFMDEYATFKKAVRRNPLTPKPAFPTHHINIHTPHNTWRHQVRKKLENKLAVLEKNIEITNHKINDLYENRLTMIEVDLKSLHIDQLPTIQQAIGYDEYLTLLQDEKHDLEIKLGNKPTSEANNQQDPEALLKTVEFTIFCQHIQRLQEIPKPTPSLKAILTQIDLFEPKFIFKSNYENDNIHFSIDLHDTYDRKIFIIAAYLYLKHKNSLDQSEFLPIYKLLIDYAKPYLDSLLALKDILEIDDNLEVLIAAYRIEELMNLFARIEEPHKIPTIDLDAIFSPEKQSIHQHAKRESQNNEKEYELKNIYRSQENIAKSKHGSRHRLFAQKDEAHDKKGELPSNENNSQNADGAKINKTPRWLFGKNT